MHKINIDVRDSNSADIVYYWEIVKKNLLNILINS